MTRLRYAVVLALLIALTPVLAVTASARQDPGAMIERLNLGDFGGGSNPQSNTISER
jgi:hypothetical protein